LKEMQSADIHISGEIGQHQGPWVKGGMHVYRIRSIVLNGKKGQKGVGEEGKEHRTVWPGERGREIIFFGDGAIDQTK